MWEIGWRSSEKWEAPNKALDQILYKVEMEESVPGHDGIYTLGTSEASRVQEL